MSPRLISLKLPQLAQHQHQLHDPLTPPELPAESSYVFMVDNTSSSDITSPATPTFSHRSALGHLRSSSSTSSLDLALSPACFADCAVAAPVSPTSTGNSNNYNNGVGIGIGTATTAPVNPPKRVLPDVQEEVPLERDGQYGDFYEEDDDALSAFPDAPDLYGCLCDEPCSHGLEESGPARGLGLDYDGFASDDDTGGVTLRSSLSLRKRYGGRRTGSRSGSLSRTANDGSQAGDSALASLTLRMGSRIHALSRWRNGISSRSRSRSNTYSSLAGGAPSSEPALSPSRSRGASRANSRAPSRAPSSRSSSVSASRPSVLFAEDYPPLPSDSYYGSTDSLAAGNSVVVAPVAPVAPAAVVSANTTPMTDDAGMLDVVDGMDDMDILDVQEAEVRRSMERDRAKATTPLLPPLFLKRLPKPSPAAVNSAMHSPPSSLQASPVMVSSANGMFPDVSIPTSAPAMSRAASVTASPVTTDMSGFPGAPPLMCRSNTMPMPAMAPMEVLPSPPLSTKQSVSSFRPPPVPLSLHSGSGSTSSIVSPLSSAVPTASPTTPSSPSGLLGSAMNPLSQTSTAPTLEFQDEWSDRLGHANYTIQPRPYRPVDASMDELRMFRADWNLARINYTKHLMRIGEHYGTTSNTYVLTEAKWAETERAWRAAHEELTDVSTQQVALAMLSSMSDQGVSPVVPRIVDSVGKFPNLGDEDIVGPMERAAAVGCFAENQHGSRRFWRNLAGKVGLKK